MLLENLLALVEKLRGRIETHGDSLRQSEWLTRYALIDPLLRELGWDTEDPDMVIPEYSVDIYGGRRARADYALMSMSNEKPMIMIEAKKLDERLDTAVSQGIQGCINTATDFFVVTDGRKWEIYETHKPVQIDQKRIASFDLLMSGVSSEVCLNALVLWRRNVTSESISPMQPPIAGLMSEASSGAAQSTDVMGVAKPAPTISVPQEPSTPKQPESSPIIQTSPPATSASFTNDGWQSLSNVQPIHHAVKPTQMMFPDNSLVAITAWNQLVIKAVQWLIDNGRLDTSHCPIQRTESRYIVADQPIHPKGSDFTNAREVKSLYVVNSFYIELSYTVPDTIKNVKFIIECAGMDASQFKVRW